MSMHVTDLKPMTKLNGDNYFHWEFKMGMYLRREKLWTITIVNSAPDPVTEWEDPNEKALTTIALCVKDIQIQHIRDCKTAKESWNALKEIYEMDSTSNRVHLLRLIMQERLSEGCAEGYVNKMHELFLKLLILDIEIKPEFFMWYAVNYTSQ